MTVCCEALRAFVSNLYNRFDMSPWGPKDLPGPSAPPLDTKKDDDEPHTNRTLPFLWAYYMHSLGANTPRPKGDSNSIQLDTYIPHKLEHVTRKRNGDI